MELQLNENVKGYIRIPYTAFKTPLLGNGSRSMRRAELSLFGYISSFATATERYLNSYKIRNTKNDRIVSSMFFGKEYFRNGGVSEPYLKIFLLKKKGITDEIREKYLKEVLPEMVRKYKDHNRDVFLQEQSYRLIVVLRDKEFKFYEIIK